MPVHQVFVENRANLATEAGSAAWLFDTRWWGSCGQGVDESAALHDLQALMPDDRELVVVERIEGDERAFARDHAPCTIEERQVTLSILSSARHQTITLVKACSDEELDAVDSSRDLPAFATWGTLRQMAWHIADTESRYYLPSLGLPSRQQFAPLLQELTESEAHTRAVLEEMPSYLVTEHEDEVWTTVKVLRRLAWHERGELAVMRRMLDALRCQES